MSDLLKRFQEDVEGRRRVHGLLLEQAAVAHDPAIAQALAQVAVVDEFLAGDVLIAQDGTETDIHFILSGVVEIEINGRQLGLRRTAGQHVGEMALIDPSKRRSATVRATVETITARVDEPTFTTLARQHPNLWRRLALELADRLRARTSFVRARRPTPVVFIGSSSGSDGLSFARAFQASYAHDPWTTRIWTDGVFDAGKTPIECLAAQLDEIDFAVLVVTPDDLLTTATASQPAPRDNVIFELGLAMGALGRDRALLLRTRGAADQLRLPSDLTGVKALEVAPGPPDTLASRVGPAANEFRALVHRIGSR